MAEILNDDALDTLFREARTYNAWAEAPITPAQIEAIYDVMKMGPTSANASPARFIWAVSPEAKARVGAHMSESNRAKSLAASAIVVIAYDLDFTERMPQLFPHDLTAKTWFEDPVVRETTAFRNSTLQGAYLLLAARALGWGTGPMSGFNNASLDADFFPGGRTKSNFITTIGKGTQHNLFPRLPRLAFGEANTVL